MVASIEELTLVMDSLIFLLENLGFLINIKKTYTPTMAKYPVFRYGNKSSGKNYSLSKIDEIPYFTLVPVSTE